MLLFFYTIRQTIKSSLIYLYTCRMLPLFCLDCMPVISSSQCIRQSLYVMWPYILLLEYYLTIVYHMVKVYLPCFVDFGTFISFNYINEIPAGNTLPAGILVNIKIKFFYSFSATESIFLYSVGSLRTFTALSRSASSFRRSIAAPRW